MRTPIVSLASAAALSIVAGSASAATFYTGMAPVVPGSTPSFIAEGRLGDSAGPAQMELRLLNPTNGSPLVQTNYNWGPSPATAGFTLNYDPGTTMLTFSLSGEDFQWVQQSLVAPTSNALSMRIRATGGAGTGTDAYVNLYGLLFNAASVNGFDAQIVGPNYDANQKFFWLGGVDFASEWTLSGLLDINFAEPIRNAGVGNHLDFAISGVTIPLPTGGALGLAGLFGVASIRRRRVR